jgi:hypothetical protein
MKVCQHAMALSEQICEHEFRDTLHGIGIKLDTFNCHDVKMWISFLCDDPQFFSRVLALNDLENSVQYRVYGLWARILPTPYMGLE